MQSRDDKVANPKNNCSALSLCLSGARTPRPGMRTQILNIENEAIMIAFGTIPIAHARLVIIIMANEIKNHRELDTINVVFEQRGGVILQLYWICFTSKILVDARISNFESACM